jgi:hypothetical protein
MYYQAATHRPTVGETSISILMLADVARNSLSISIAQKILLPYNRPNKIMTPVHEK